MAKSYSAARAFDVGPGDPPQHYEAGDSFPGDSPHLSDLVKGGYVQEGSTAGAKASGPIDPATNLPPKDAEVYEENEGSVADVAGNEIDVVGDATPDASDVQAEPPAKRAKRAGSKRSTPKRSSSKRSTAKR